MLLICIYNQAFLFLNMVLSHSWCLCVWYCIAYEGQELLIKMVKIEAVNHGCLLYHAKFCKRLSRLTFNRKSCYYWRHSVSEWEREKACPCIYLHRPWLSALSLLPLRLIIHTAGLICLQASACAEQFHMWSVWLLMEVLDRNWCIRLSGAGGVMRWTLITLPTFSSRRTVLPGQPVSWR